MREAAGAEMIEYLIDRKKYTVAGYSNYDSTEPLNTALLDPLLGCWRTRVYRTRDAGKAEIRCRGHSSYLLQIKS